MTKSDNPDVWLIFLQREKVSVNQFNAGWGYGWGWGWNPTFGEDSKTCTNTEGTLFYDLIDAKKQELIWQGKA
jgi:hypothetical protein